MKKPLKLLLFIFVLFLFSCSNDDKVDCLAEKLEIIEKYDALILLEETNELNDELLERNKQIELEALDC